MPNEFDTQGDMATAEEIEKAAWNYMRRLQGLDPVTKTARSMLQHLVKAAQAGSGITVDITEFWSDVEKGAAAINDMHERDLAGEQPEIVESYLSPSDFTLQAHDGSRLVKRGTWMLGVVWPEQYFQKILRRERTGYSMEGKGRRVPVG